MDKDFLLNAYGEQYGADAGPWNLGLKNKYLEYMFAKFFEENFSVEKETNICNIGIGAGYWDRYLSYKLINGALTSVDIDSDCCIQLSECLKNEKNPNEIHIINDNALNLNPNNKFDIITMVGSTRLESGMYEKLIIKIFSLLNDNGSFYYQTLDKNENKEDFEKLCSDNNMVINNYLLDESYGFKSQYWKVSK